MEAPEEETQPEVRRSQPVEFEDEDEEDIWKDNYDVDDDDESLLGSSTLAKPRLGSLRFDDDDEDEI